MTIFLLEDIIGKYIYIYICISKYVLKYDALISIINNLHVSYTRIYILNESL